jgi:hypothetical protein
MTGLICNDSTALRGFCCWFVVVATSPNDASLPRPVGVSRFDIGDQLRV